MSNVIWINKPSILINEKYIHEIYPKSNMSKFRKINAVTRLIILLTILFLITTYKVSYLISGIVSLVLIYIITSNNKKEGFKMKKEKTKKELYVDNPLNNVLPGDDPEREPAEKAYEKKSLVNINESVKEMIQQQNSSIDNINDKLFKDLGENLEFDRSMRQFYTTANTTIPNDQKGFAEYCYKDMVSGKEGDESALLKNTVHLHKSHL